MEKIQLKGRHTKEDFRKYVVPPLKVIGIVGLPIFGGIAMNDAYHNHAIHDLEREESGIVEFYKKGFDARNGDKHEFDDVVAREEGAYVIHQQYDEKITEHANKTIIFRQSGRCTFPPMIIVGNKMVM
jgi:hypothetical protein